MAEAALRRIFGAEEARVYILTGKPQDRMRAAAGDTTEDKPLAGLLSEAIRQRKVTVSENAYSKPLFNPIIDIGTFSLGSLSRVETNLPVICVPVMNGDGVVAGFEIKYKKTPSTKTGAIAKYYEVDSATQDVLGYFASFLSIAVAKVAPRA